MINLVTGLPGSGKSLWTLKTVFDYVAKENKALALQGKPLRQVFYHGIPELTLSGWTLMDTPEDWINLPSNSIFVIDECQSTFRPRAASVKPPLYISEFETHRHKGLDCFLLTQHPMLVDGNIRRLAGKHYHVVRFYGFQKATVHEFQGVRDNVDKNRKNSIETHFIYPKEVFSWYKSADAHTMKKRIPMRMVMIVVLPVLTLVAGYFTYKSLTDIATKPVEFAKQNELPTSDNTIKTQEHTSVNGTSYASGDIKRMSYIEAHTPEVQDMPFTAPIYAEVTKPITAPYPAGCVYMQNNGCKCYTQQGTALNVQLNVCLNIVKNGFFVDWDTSARNHDDETKQVSQQSGLLRGGQPLDGGLNVPAHTVGLSSRPSPNNF